MNRLVIIGNGFDLAHGLPTSYEHFIDNFWKSLKDCHTNEDYEKLVYVNQSHKNFLIYNLINNYSDFRKSIKEYSNTHGYQFIENFQSCHTNISLNNGQGLIFEFKNEFFKKINLKRIKNWVDIENEYYSELKRIINSEKLPLPIIGVEEKRENEITKLNREFDEIKILLIKYLKEEVEKKYLFKGEMSQDYLDIFRNNSYQGNSLERFYMEISKKDELYFRNESEKKNNEGEKNRIVLNNYFLSFNYTSTVNNYCQFLDYKISQLIEIHGSLNGAGSNPINFGFGDEMDNNYQKIEEINDNEYLTYIKSFQYSDNSNYKRLLDLIDSEKFQVYIMGHSCGLSDRTLLNTIFEHENCRSIKVFYHQKQSENGFYTDNFTEIIQNISRHFNKKKLMREKIVNKTLCQPMPQIQLSKFENINGIEIRIQ